ncbi:MAG TPA: cation diffusion facilitator family transporter [Rhizomicrobium sp.]|nr:cation diffusion facilitator family transporter [Rhizomicrobium sp.]
MTDATFHQASEPGSWMRRAAWAAVGVAGILILLKAVAFIITGSVAMMASLADSGLDLIGSTINLVAVSHALTPADREHRFGHGKAEPLAGLAQGSFIAGSAMFLVIESVQRLITPQPVVHGVVGLAVMGFSIVAVTLLVIFQRITVARTGSPAIGADSIHYLGDLATNLGVVVGIVLSTEFGLWLADPIVGLVIAGILAVSSLHVLRQSYDQLMDRELPDEERARIKKIVMEHEDVRSLHDLRTRAAGISTFIQMHIELDPALSLTRAHEVSDEVEADLRAAYPNAEVMIHQDPAGLETPPELARS